jgi:isoquinoline 1-oxidoreductase beta subunit
MLFASIERPPSLGAKARHWDEKAPARFAVCAPSFRGERRSGGGDSTWAALKGREALAVDWDESEVKRFDSNQHRDTLEKSSREPGIMLRQEKPANPANSLLEPWTQFISTRSMPMRR